LSVSGLWHSRDMTAALFAPGKELIAAMPPFSMLGLAAIRLVQTQAQAAVALAELKAVACLGFDTESRPTFHKGQTSDGPHLVQFSTRDQAWLFQTRQPEAQAAIAGMP